MVRTSYPAVANTGSVPATGAHTPQVRLGEQAAHGPDALDDLGGQLAPVEHVFAPLGDLAQRASQPGHPEQRARQGRSAVAVQQDGRGGRVAGHPGHLLGEYAAIEIADGEAVSGVVDGWLQQPTSVQRPVGLVEGQPARDVAGHQRREDARLLGFRGEPRRLRGHRALPEKFNTLVRRSRAT